MLHDMELPRYRLDSTGWPDQLIPLIQQRPLRFLNGRIDALSSRIDALHSRIDALYQALFSRKDPAA